MAILSAQTIYGSLTGTIFDPTGAVVPNATVEVKSIQTGIARTLTSDANGFWKAPSLLPGDYSVKVSASGFEGQIKAPIRVEAAVERNIDFSLAVGSASEIISVTEEAPLIEATRAQISKGVEQQRIMELPGLNTLNGLALLMPGTNPNAQGRPGSGFVVNGARTRSNNFMLDGANNNDQSLSVPRQNPPPEILTEFRIITNNFSAEFGRNSGSVVQQNTRSGSNEFHGVGRWSWLGNGLNSLTTDEQRTFSARKAAGLSDYAATRAARGVIVRNQLNGGIGGPIKRNHTFFYANYFRDSRRSSASPVVATISQAGFQALKQNEPFFSTGVVDFLASLYPVANDSTSRGNLSVPLPNGQTITIPIQQYNRAAAEGTLPYARNTHSGFLRIDTRLSDKDNMFVRYLIDDDLDPGTPNALKVNQLGNAIRNQNVALNEVRLWTPTLVSETRLTYGRRSANFVENFPAQLSITGSGLPTIGNQNYPQYRTDNLYELTSNWTWSRGNHTMRFGGNYLQYRLNSFFAPASRGVITYQSFSALLFDQNAQFSQYAGTGSVPAKTHETQMFFADDWRLTPELTLNIGGRYEVTSAPFGYFSNASKDINNVSPRFGFAWAPKKGGWMFGDGKFVLRGGYAISYDQVFQNILLNVSRNYPRGITITDANMTGLRVWDANSAYRKQPPPDPEEFIRRGGNPLTLPYRLYSPNKRIAQPYGQQFSLGIERQLSNDYAFKLFYVGTRGIDLIREAEINLGFFQAAINANPSLYAGVITDMVPTTVSGQAALRRDPTRGSIAVGDGYGQSTYHSLQATLTKRFSQRLVFEANYTWSSFINDTDDILGGQANRTYPSVPFAPKLDRARSGYDVPHRFVANYVYELPNWGEGNAILNRVIGGWQFSGVTTLATGTPYSILNANNPLGILPGAVATINLSQRAGYNPSGVPFTATSSSQPNPQWMAYANNTGLIGAGANVVRLGNIYNFDMAMAKNIKTFKEGQNLQLRWEVFNVFNHRNFDQLPANSASANTNLGTFMNLGFTNVAGREMSVMVRYIF